ncbi:hypothetical protein CCMA1212_009788 [Trichoderma ghanense]|uniref:Uncharacterized protein n=1 Tax=Trichoderma ghanense TaxID=65468 RepID=A0ABY2GS46_9HYPO
MGVSEGYLVSVPTLSEAPYLDELLGRRITHLECFVVPLLAVARLFRGKPGGSLPRKPRVDRPDDHMPPVAEEALVLADCVVLGS